MKTNIKKIAAILSLFMCSVFAFSQSSQGDIRGLITDEVQNPAIGAQVTVLQAGIVVKQTVADIEGKYTIKPLQPGTYEVSISYTGYNTSHYEKVKVVAEESSYLDAELEINTLTEVVIVPKIWNKSMVDKSYITMHKIDYDQISKMAVTKGDVKGMIANISSDIFVTESGQIYSRGSRVGASKTYVDGELLPFADSDVTGMAIQSLTVITGGIPAQYGDLTGAAIIVTTRDYFSGIAEKNIRIGNRKERIENSKKEAEFEVQKKKREAEIEEEKKQQQLQK
ncbi:MAG: carboxypeptidase-like regulatory domain-containing protein [Bacteroidota bacterium]|nr:carboxypeptidase-like regulatory domain-containing protein [Bacteroidota bacterium]